MTGADDKRDQVRERLRQPVPRERRKVGGQVSELVVDDERCDREFEQGEADRRRDAWEATQIQRTRDRAAERRGWTLGRRLDASLAEIELGKGIRARPIASHRAGSDDHPGGRRPNDALGTEIDQAVARIHEHVSDWETGRNWSPISTLTLGARLDLAQRGGFSELSLHICRNHVRTIEQALDAELGLIKVQPIGDTPGRTGGIAAAGGSHAQERAARMIPGADRDRDVWERWQGVDSKTVAREAPHLGKDRRTIEKARLREAAVRRLRVDPKTGEVLGKVEEAA